MIGNTTLAELESSPKDSDLVGGASSTCTYLTAAKAQREFGLFGVTSATVRTFLLRAAVYTTAHYKDNACKTSSRTAVAQQTGSFLAVSYPSDCYCACAVHRVEYGELNMGVYSILVHGKYEVCYHLCFSRSSLYTVHARLPHKVM